MVEDTRQRQNPCGS